MLNRRRLLQAGSLAPVALSTGLARSQTKPDKLTILSHRVHMSVLTGAKGGNATAEWSARNGIAIVPHPLSSAHPEHGWVYTEPDYAP